MSIILFFKIAFCIAIVFLILGLIRPVISLWFLDRFNRQKVIKYYGMSAVILFLILILLKKFIL
ncbi:MAG: hypothetical protein EA341_01690 [Mongoliibacter sp.]|nr:MAG: hypothetical protein EA341_01690 [Mongoliibacter sp.]